MNNEDHSRNRRNSDYYEEEENGLRLVRKSGIPLLYILGACINIVGITCLTILTSYWANLTNPMCYLYAQTASNTNVYLFGSSLSNCYWVSYGAIPCTIIAIVCGALYMLKVFGDPADKYEEESQIFYTKILVIGMVVASVLLLAVCCTIAEGMRVTCTNMGLNAVNGRADNCMDKLNLRVAMYSLPVESSTMLNVGSICLWGGMLINFFLVVMHFISLCRTAY